MNAIDRVAPHPAGRGRLVLDISRLLSRARAVVPTGIDRVELAWAEHLLAEESDRLEFTAIHPLGRGGALPFAASARFVTALSQAWRGGARGEAAGLLGRRLLHGLLLPRARTPRLPRASKAVPTIDVGPSTAPAIYLLLSHQNLDRSNLVANALLRHRARLVPMIHDLIPIEYPEYCAPTQPARHRARVATVARLADAVIVPSAAVRDTLMPLLASSGRRDVPVRIVPNGVHLRAVAASGDAPGHGVDIMKVTPPTPYFVCLGTIEPRKNHALLLAIWRRLVAARGAATPRLVLVGRRGWECEHVHRIIDRTPALKGVVEEHNALPDAAVVTLLRGACALLYPSFAEGFGLPLAEALALGVPVVCSDIAVHREVGGAVPIYLDPTDGLGWYAAIEDLAGPGGDRHRAQMSRHAGDRPWHDWPQTVRSALRDLERGSNASQQMAEAGQHA